MTDFDSTHELLSQQIQRQDGSKSPGWTAFQALLYRRWFRRCWVIQEVAMAVDVLVICGKCVIP